MAKDAFEETSEIEECCFPDESEESGPPIDMLDSLELLEEDIPVPIDVSEVGEMEEVIEEPHIKILRVDLDNFLRTARQLAGLQGKDTVTRSVSLKSVGGRVRLCVTDLEMFFEQSAERLNTTNILEDHIVLPLDTLVRAIRAVGTYFVLLKREGGYYLRLIGGDLLMDTYAVAEERFVFSEEVVKKGVVGSAFMGNICRDFAPVVQASPSVMERRILIEGGNAYAIYDLSAVWAETTLPDMDLKLRDMGVMRNCLPNSDELLTVWQTTESAKVKRMVVRGSAFQYAFMVSNLKPPESIIKVIPLVLSEDGVAVEQSRLFLMVELAGSLPYATGRVGFNFSEDGGIWLTVNTRNKGKALEFFIKGTGRRGNPVPLKSPVEFPASKLATFLKSFNRFQQVQVCLTAKGIGLSSEGYAAVFMPS